MLKIKNVVAKSIKNIMSTSRNLKNFGLFTKTPYNNTNPRLPNQKHLNRHLISKNYYLFSKMVDSIKYPTKDSILSFLKDSGIEYKIHDHLPIETVPAGLEYFSSNNPYGSTEFTFVKNLFLKNKQGGFILLTAHNVSSRIF